MYDQTLTSVPFGKVKVRGDSNEAYKQLNGFYMTDGTKILVLKEQNVTVMDEVT